MVVAGLLSEVFFLSCGLSQRETVSARRLLPRYTSSSSKTWTIHLIYCQRVLPLIGMYG